MLLSTQNSIAANDSELEHSAAQSEPEEPDTDEQGWGAKIIVFPLVFTVVFACTYQFPSWGGSVARYAAGWGFEPQSEEE